MTLGWENHGWRPGCRLWRSRSAATDSRSCSTAPGPTAWTPPPGRPSGCSRRCSRWPTYPRTRPAACSTATPMPAISIPLRTVRVYSIGSSCSEAAGLRTSLTTSDRRSRPRSVAGSNGICCAFTSVAWRTWGSLLRPGSRRRPPTAQHLAYGLFLWAMTQFTPEELTTITLRRLGRAVEDHHTFELLGV